RMRSSSSRKIKLYGNRRIMHIRIPESSQSRCRDGLSWIRLRTASNSSRNPVPSPALRSSYQAIALQLRLRLQRQRQGPSWILRPQPREKVLGRNYASLTALNLSESLFGHGDPRFFDVLFLVPVQGFEQEVSQFSAIRGWERAKLFFQLLNGR